VLQYIYDKNVRHADISSKNILLDANRNILAGSSIDDVRSTVIAQVGFWHTGDDVNATIRSEIHDLGSSIFELITFTCPHWREEAKVEGMAAALLQIPCCY